MVKNPTKKTSVVKAVKPHPDLWLHPSGRWCKKHSGRAHYFGKTDDDPTEVAARYLAARDDWAAGRAHRPACDGLTLQELCNRFLTWKQGLVDAGEITLRTFRDYHATCGRLIAVFGKRRVVVDLASNDFERLRATLSRTRNAVSLGNEITRIRVVFKYAFDSSLIDRPVRCGTGFKKPPKRVLRKLRNEQGPRMFEPKQIRKLLDAAPLQLEAMILLGCNVGMGNADIGNLTTKHLDLKAKWLDYPRPKTGVARRVPLWPETVKALRKVLDNQPKSKETTDYVFLTRLGHSWAKETAANPLSRAFRKLLDDEGLYRPGLGFYTLRHVAETIGGDTRDQPAVDAIMGHSRDDMASVYREGISDARLRAVVNHVHKWLFTKGD